MRNPILRRCDTVRETGFAIHRDHRHGHLEKFYDNALAHRLRKQGLQVQTQHPLQVFDEDGTLLGELRSSHLEHGLLANLGAPKFSIRKYALSNPEPEEL